MKHHFSDEWSRIRSINDDAYTASINIEKTLFPYIFASREMELLDIAFIALSREFSMEIDSSIFAGLTISKVTTSDQPNVQLEADPSILSSEDSDYNLVTAKFSELEDKNLGIRELSVPAELTAAIKEQLRDLLIVCRFKVNKIND